MYFMPYDSEGYDNIHVPLGTSDANYGVPPGASSSKITYGPSGGMSDNMPGSMSSEMTYGPSGGMSNDMPGAMGSQNPLTNSLVGGNSNGMITNAPMNDMNNSSMNYQFAITPNTIMSSQTASAPSSGIRVNQKPTEGMTTLKDMSAPIGPEMSVDIYSQAKGSSSCEASPYSNSTGYLCLNDEQEKLLKTRGGNQTGN